MVQMPVLTSQKIRQDLRLRIEHSSTNHRLAAPFSSFLNKWRYVRFGNHASSKLL